SYILARSHDIDGPQTIATVLADRAIGLVSVVVMAFLATFVLDMPQLRVTVWIVTAVGALGIVGVALLLRYTGPISSEDTGGGPAGVAKKVVSKARQTAVALGNYRDRPGALIAAFVVSCAGMVVAGVAVQEYALAFGFYCPIVTAVAIIAVLTAVTMVPVSINGLGLAEGTIIVLLTWSGMDETAAFGAAVASRVFSVLISLLGGLLQLLPEPYGPKV
ncbi:MAG: YbhN family protein, partial [Armatimonadota bacterium]